MDDLIYKMQKTYIVDNDVEMDDYEDGYDEEDEDEYEYEDEEMSNLIKFLHILKNNIKFNIIDPKFLNEINKQNKTYIDNFCFVISEYNNPSTTQKNFLEMINTNLNNYFKSDNHTEKLKITYETYITIYNGINNMGLEIKKYPNYTGQP